MKTWKDPKRLVEFEAFARLRSPRAGVCFRWCPSRQDTRNLLGNECMVLGGDVVRYHLRRAARPHLWTHLIGDPIEAMIAGGFENDGDVIAQGVALARKSDPYVPLTDEMLARARSLRRAAIPSGYRGACPAATSPLACVVMTLNYRRCWCTPSPQARRVFWS